MSAPTAQCVSGNGTTTYECNIIDTEPKHLILSAKYLHPVTRKLLLTKKEAIELPFDNCWKYSILTVYNNVLYVFVIADDMQTCALYDFMDCSYCGYNVLDTKIPDFTLLKSVNFIDDNTINVIYITQEQENNIIITF
jgi:hypothetical protein